MAASSSGSKRGKKKSTIHRDLRTGLSIQRTVRSDGRTWTHYRKPTDGKFISKAEYEELLKKNPVVSVLSDARQGQTSKDDLKAASVDLATPIASREIPGTETKTDREGISAETQASENINGTQIDKDVDPVTRPSERSAGSDHPQQPDENSSEKTTGTKISSEPPLDDSVVDILKGELPLLHEFLKINVELLKLRIQNGKDQDSVPDKAKNGQGAGSNQFDAHNAGSGQVVQGSGPAVGTGVAVDGNVDTINFVPPDPEKQREEDFKKNVLGGGEYRRKVEEWVHKYSKPGSRPSLSGLNLSNLPLHKIKLPNADFNEAKLNNCKLLEANLENADFRGADLSGADLSGAILTRAKFSGGKTNLTGVTMKGQKTQCAYANFDDALLDGIQIENADLHGATIRNAKLRGAQLSRVNLEGVDLSGSDLSGATLNNINLERTILDGVIIDDIGKVKADIKCRPILQVACSADPDPDIVKGASFKKAILRGACLAGYDLTGSNFVEADLTLSKLGKANLTGANLVQTNLDHANLHGAILRQAKLNNAYLGGTILSYADLKDADLAGANLRGANLKGAKVSNERLSAARDLSGAVMPDGSIHP